jgi:hypothetical protein
VIDYVVLAVADSGVEGSDPDTQHGLALDLVLGPVGAGQTIEGEHPLTLREFPPFVGIPYAGHLLWTDIDGNSWTACGSSLRRRPSPARTC